MTTAAALIDETVGLCLAGTRERTNKLAVAVSTTTQTTITFSYDLQSIQENTVIGVDLELMYVVDVDSGAKTATVIRGYLGSTAATHLIDSLVVSNPKYSRFAVLRAINADLDDLSARGLYQDSYVDLTYQSAKDGYNLTSVAAIEGVVDVWARRTGGRSEWDPLPRGLWEVQRNASTSDFASGFAIQVLGGPDVGQTFRVIYKAPFTHLAAEADDVQSVAGLEATMNDLPPMGAAMRLVLGRETARNATDTQGDTRRPDEVPAGANAASASAWKTLREERIKNELKRLMRRYPRRRY
jgi:hypothetical protein